MINFDLHFRQFIILVISAYQKFLSPIKGFSCAYRVHHNEESCSSYVKRTFLTQDLQTAINLSKTRFKDCSEANRILKAEQENQELIQLIGRRKAVNLFSFFVLGFMFPQFTPQGRARGSCSTCSACFNR